MGSTIHDVDSFRGRRVTLYVSDPWDFGTENGVGPFGGRIQQINGNLLAISLDREVSFLGETFAGLVAAFRTQSGAADIRSANGASANFEPITDATSSAAFADAEKRRRWGLTGSIAIAEG